MYRPITIAFCSIAFLGNAAHADSPSDYAGQQYRPIKALSPDDVQAYLAGKGMGLAKAAELNGYPGPSHVLAMADELELTLDQRQQTQALFKNMQSQAVVLGNDLVEEERNLDNQFASKTVSRESLSRSLKAIADTQAKVRETHLAAHLAQIAILSDAQVAKYIALRGYAGGAGPETHSDHKH